MKNYLMLLVLALWATAAFSATAPQTIDLSSGWKFKPEPVGTMPHWEKAALADGDWAIVKAGTRWEDQGFADTDGYAWYRKEVDIPATWANHQTWLIIGAVNDAFALFCNGRLVNEFGDSLRHTIANIPSMANLTPYLLVGKKNVLALRVLDWGGSGGLWQPPCLLTMDSATIDTFPVLFCEPTLDGKQLDVNLNLTQLGRHWQHTRLDLSLLDRTSGRVLQQKTQQMSDDPGVLSFQFKNMEEPAASTLLKARLTAEKGKVLLERSRIISSPKTAATANSHHRILNNFVTELLRQPLTSTTQMVEFANPRDGWVFFALQGNIDQARAKLDHKDAIIWRVNPASHAPEAMRYLAKGPHTLEIIPSATGDLIIRAIPEIIYSQYPSTPHLEPFGPYDWNFLTRHVLPHVNTMVTGGVPDQAASWRAEGRKWLVDIYLPGLGDKVPPTTAKVYESWSTNPGANRPEFGGIIVDEFMLRPQDYYQPWTEAMVSLYKNPAFSGKHFYAYCNDLFQNPYLPAFAFSKILLQHGGYFAMERYLPLPASEAEAKALLQEELQQSVLSGSHQLPDLKQHLVICLGYMCDPPEMLNRLPNVNFKVFMDMQFHFLANNPAFSGLFGLQEYLSSYADEEMLRWAHQLFRHYCIEGKVTRYTTEPYQLPHLKNPDFVDGLSGWHPEPAMSSSIAPGKLAGFSWLQGRYPEIATGDQGAVFKRSAQRPNRLHQTLQALKPGQWYSVKMISADVNQLDVKRPSGLSVTIANGRIDPKRTFTYVYPSNYAHTFGPYNADHPAWITYQRVVFCAQGTTAELTISDWPNDATPGGPTGQEMICNFLEARPYLMEE